MTSDYNELERRIIERMRKELPPADDDTEAKMIDWIHKEAIYCAILVLSEYEQMKEQSQA